MSPQKHEQQYYNTLMSLSPVLPAKGSVILTTSKRNQRVIFLCLHIGRCCFSMQKVSILNALYVLFHQRRYTRGGLLYVHVILSSTKKNKRCHWAIAVLLSKATCRYLCRYSSTQMGNRRFYKYVNHICPNPQRRIHVRIHRCGCQVHQRDHQWRQPDPSAGDHEVLGRFSGPAS